MLYGSTFEMNRALDTVPRGMTLAMGE